MKLLSISLTCEYDIAMTLASVKPLKRRGKRLSVVGSRISAS